MTFVEFFDRTAVENLCACLVNVPERVVLLGDKMELMQAHALRYEQIFAQRGHTVDFVCRTVNRNNLGSIVDSLCWIVERYDDCVFGLTGGEDLCLAAIGVVSERYKEKNIQMHRFNIHNGTVTDCDQDGVTITTDQVPMLSVEENIRVYGGDVIYEDVKKDGTVRWDMNPDFRQDIRNMWLICRPNPGLWNVQTGLLEAMETFRPRNDTSMTLTVPVASLEKRLNKEGRKLRYVQGFFKALKESKLLTDYEKTEDYLTVTYKNEQVRACLTKSGLALEMRIYLAALECEAKDGTPVYQDAMNGVCIDWDGRIHTQPDSYDTENEIDVMMMHGVVPVFVSCKNGEVKMEELYKLNTVALRFGGRHAKKVLVAPALVDQKENAEYIRERARDMGIRLVEKIRTGDDEALNKTVRSFWSN